MKILKLYLFCLLFLVKLHAGPNSKIIQHGEQEASFFSMSYDATRLLITDNIGNGKYRISIKDTSSLNHYDEEVSQRLRANFIEPSNDVLTFEQGAIRINRYSSYLGRVTTKQIIVPELENVHIDSINTSYYSKDRSTIFFTVRTNRDFLNFVIKLVEAKVTQIESESFKASCLSEDGTWLATLNRKNTVYFYNSNDFGAENYSSKTHSEEMSFSNLIFSRVGDLVPETIKFLLDGTVMVVSKTSENGVVVDNFSYQNKNLYPDSNHIRRIELGKLNHNEEYFFKFSAINDSTLMIFSKALKSVIDDTYEGKIRLYDYVNKTLIDEIFIITKSHNQDVLFSEYGLSQLKYLYDRYSLKNNYYYYMFSLSESAEEKCPIVDCQDERNLELIRELAKNGSLEKFTQYGLSATSAATFIENLETICDAQDDQITIKCLAALKNNFNGDEEKLLNSLARVLGISYAGLNISLSKIK